MAELNDFLYVDNSEFACNSIDLQCAFRERTISFANFVQIPEPVEPPEVIFKECCYLHYVLASSEDDSSYKNDFSGFWHQRQVPSETAEFVMIDMSNDTEYELNDDTYGDFKDFGAISNNGNLKYFVLDWKKVLLDLGEGAYKVVKRLGVVGLEIEQEYLVYNLKEYSSLYSDKTFRMDVTMSGLLEEYNADFTDSGFKSSLRVPGFFGRGDFSLEEDILVDRNYNKRQISIKQTRTYKLQTNLIPVCVKDEITDFLILSDDIRINDYNLNNHSYSYVDFAVKFENNDGTEYFTETRKAILNLVFNDKVVNKNKRNY